MQGLASGILPGAVLRHMCCRTYIGFTGAESSLLSVRHLRSCCCGLYLAPKNGTQKSMKEHETQKENAIRQSEILARFLFPGITNEAQCSKQDFGINKSASFFSTIKNSKRKSPTSLTEGTTLRLECVGACRTVAHALIVTTPRAKALLPELQDSFWALST